MSGRPRSSTTRSGRRRAAASRAAPPVAAHTTMCPSRSRYCCTTSAMRASSSTTRMRVSPAMRPSYPSVTLRLRSASRDLGGGAASPNLVACTTSRREVPCPISGCIATPGWSPSPSPSSASSLSARRETPVAERRARHLRRRAGDARPDDARRGVLGTGRRLGRRREGRDLGGRDASSAKASRRTSTPSPPRSTTGTSRCRTSGRSIRDEARGTIVIVAGRDSPPRSTQGADANASGTATLLELARVFTVTGPRTHPGLPLDRRRRLRGARSATLRRAARGRRRRSPCIALRRTASRDADGLAVDGWSPAPRTAPPWALAAVRHAGQSRREPRSTPAQRRRPRCCAWPCRQAPAVKRPFVALGRAGALAQRRRATRRPARGHPRRGVLRSARRRRPHGRVDDHGDRRRADERAQQRRHDLPPPRPDAPRRALSRCSSSRSSHPSPPSRPTSSPTAADSACGSVPAWARLALHIAPWFVVVGIVYLSNLVGLLPRSPGAVDPARSRLSSTSLATCASPRSSSFCSWPTPTRPRSSGAWRAASASTRGRPSSSPTPACWSSP